MSAASASAAIGGAPSTVQSVPSVPPSRVKKRSVATSKPSVDADSPLLPVGRARRAGDLAACSANGGAVADFTLLSHPSDLSHAPREEDELAAGHQQTSRSTIAAATGKNSPFKTNTRKHAVHKDSNSAARKRASSMLDLTGPLFSRFFLILVLGAGFGTSLWNWRMRPEIVHSTRLISTEVEKLEEFVARTTKWMQVQLQVVDMKIGQQVGDLKRELQKEFDAQLLHAATEVRNLKDKIEKTGAELDALFNDGGPLTKKEALALVKNVVEKRAAEGKGQALSLDDVRMAARQVTVRELERHSADGIGRTDYALGSGGGRVISHSEGYFLGREADWWNAVGFFPGANRRHPLADNVIQPSFGEPGHCLPLKGSDVWVQIVLRTLIRPEAVTLEHVSKENAFDVSSAPREFRVFGWRQVRGQADKRQDSMTFRFLGEFKYDIDRPNVQTFALAEEDVSGLLINVVRLHVLSNYGSASHTCLYRVRVHGSDPKMNLKLNNDE